MEKHCHKITQEGKKCQKKQHRDRGKQENTEKKIKSYDTDPSAEAPTQCLK